MKYYIKHLCLFFLLLSSCACKDPVIKSEMVKFDKAFIPAYYYSYVGDMESARKAMIPLNRRWLQFKHRYVSNIDHCDKWNESIRMVDAWIVEANDAIEDNDAFRAASQLDHARYEMMDIRWKEDIDYYLDYVWDLEGSIGVAIDVSTDPMLDLLSWKEFYTISQSVLEAWEILEKQDLDTEFFDLEITNKTVIPLRKQRLHMAILDFLEAVDCADACKFAEAALQLEPAYFDYLALFGDFESANTYYAGVRLDGLHN